MSSTEVNQLDHFLDPQLANVDFVANISCSAGHVVEDIRHTHLGNSAKFMPILSCRELSILLKSRTYSDRAKEQYQKEPPLWKSTICDGYVVQLIQNRPAGK